MPASHLSKSRRRSPASLVLDRYGVSQNRLADALGLSYSSLSRILQGSQPAPAGFESALKIALGNKGAEELLEAMERAEP